MRYLNPEEVVKQTPEERVVNTFVAVFGEEQGKKIALEFATLPEHSERYQQMLVQERKHIDNMRKLLLADACVDENKRRITIKKKGFIARIKEWLS